MVNASRVFTSIAAAKRLHAIRLEADTEPTAVEIAPAPLLDFRPGLQFARTTDVTSLIRERDEVDLRCCCEKKDQRRCHVYFLDEIHSPWWREDKCKDATPPFWSRVERLMHFDRAPEGKCRVPDMELPVLLARLGSVSGYCRHEMHMDDHGGEIIVVSGQLGHIVEPSCPPGWKAKDVECTFVSLTAGKFLPEPRCEIIQDYCKGSETVPAASLGSVVDVNCGARKVLTKTSECVMVSQFEGIYDPDPSPSKACEQPGGFGRVILCQRALHTFFEVHGWRMFSTSQL